MTYQDLYEKAIRLLDNGEITIGEYDEMIKPLKCEICEWIPVSKGLPKKDNRYHVTRHDDVTNTEFIDILWYEKNIWWNGHSTGDYAVTAWMPLPKPYREDGE